MEHFYVTDNDAFGYRDNRGEEHFCLVKRDSVARNPRQDEENECRLYLWHPDFPNLGDSNQYGNKGVFLQDLVSKYFTTYEMKIHTFETARELLEPFLHIERVWGFIPFKDTGVMLIAAADENPFCNEFPSGILGYAIVYPQDIGIYVNIHETFDFHAYAHNAIQTEVQEYDHYLRNDIYELYIYDSNGAGEPIDHVRGFYGNDLASNNMLDYLYGGREALKNGTISRYQHSTCETHFFDAFSERNSLNNFDLYDDRTSPLDLVGLTLRSTPGTTPTQTRLLPHAGIGIPNR